MDVPAYSREQHLADKNELEQVHAYAQRAIDSLLQHFDWSSSSWPYVVSHARVAETKYSFSTNAMTAFALAVSGGTIATAPLLPIIEPGYRDVYATATDSGVIQRASDKLVKRCQREEQRTSGRVLTWSGSFGENDPFTLSWLAGLRPSVKGPHAREWSRSLDSAISKLAKRVLTGRDFHPVLGVNNSYQHAFPLLRVTHLIISQHRRPGAASSESVSRLLEFFRTRLHQYLAYFLTNNSRFDAAELVFSLEAMLQCDPDSLDEATLEQFFSVIDQSQQRNLNWRPLRPFIADDRGGATLPLSVEIASSLLRICSLLDHRWAAGRYFSRHVTLFRRFTSWIFSCSTHGRNDAGAEFFGWSSEHIYEPDKVHTWQTSQVLLYLLYYGALLARHAATESLRSARLALPREVPREKAGDDTDPWTYWQSTVSTREPIDLARGRLRVYEDIGAQFIRPRSPATGQTSNASWSMILYGPPGTGKTALAEQIAAALKWPLLSIFPGDFIVEGEGGVEERAKNIFDATQQLADCVILFDEIDRLILDRDSRLYEAQSDAFQFMTPGMLTKIHELRAKSRSIFIIGTNFSERIDPAIKRVGRIDRVYALMPPDLKQRTRILETLLAKSKTRIRPREADIAAVTYFSTYGELKQFVRALPAGRVAPRSRELAIELHSQRAIRLLNYRSRFRFSNPNLPTVQEPYEEFLLLLFLLQECDVNLPALPREEYTFLLKFAVDFSAGDKRRQTNIDQKLKSYLPGCPELHEKLTCMIADLADAAEDYSSHKVDCSASIGLRHSRRDGTQASDSMSPT